MQGQNERNNGFSTGLLLGLFLGVCLTLLLVTKKGRRILKTLTEKGLDNIKDLKTKLREADVQIDEDLYHDDLEEESSTPVLPKPTPVVSSAEKPEPPKTNGIKKHAKKLFRGIPKKS